ERAAPAIVDADAFQSGKGFSDELLEMARASGYQQDVMKMTQLIWYRSQTAPKTALAETQASPWVDQDPDADYITIA
ncbi:MAG TPA: hypothetical protein PLF42_17975, partial [Anaerolineales bacterium]|nr:hypothetical protein [Anaerolineales bacterium]